MDLDLDITGDTVPPLLQEVLACQTIVRLKLGREFRIDILPENASFPVLKTLFLDSIEFSNRHHCAFESLLSACPVVEELVMHNVESSNWTGAKGCCTVSCPTLKRLTINSLRLSPHFPWHVPLKNIAFDTPNLAYLEYYDVAPVAFPIVTLDSHVEAKLNIVSEVDFIDSNPTNLIKGLGNVEVLDLSTPETLKTIHSFFEAIPVFNKLLHLSITTESNEYWVSLPFMLKKSPNLHTLLIKGPLRIDDDDEIEPEYVSDRLYEYSCLSCPVKVLHITEFGGSSGELEQLNHFLELLPSLELVKVCTWATDEKEKLQITKELRMLPKSSKCEIVVNFIGT